MQATFGVDNTNTVTMYAGSTYPSGDARYHIYVDGKLATNITIPPNTPGKDFTIAAGLDSSASHTITVRCLDAVARVIVRHVLRRCGT